MPLNDKKLLQLRLSRSLSQNEVSQSANISQATLSYMESGKYADYRVSQIQALASYYNVSIDYLMDHSVEGSSIEGINRGLAESAKTNLLSSLEYINQLLNR